MARFLLDLTATEKIRAEFDKAVARATDAEAAARLEVAREFFLNQDFRKALSDASFEATFPG